MVEVDGHSVRVRGIVHEREPLDDVALDGVGDVVDGVGAVGEAEVDDGRGARARIGSRIAPEEIGGVEIVVSPERRERRQERRKLGMKWREQIESLIGAGANGSVVGERGTGGEIAGHLRGGSCAAKMVKLATSGRGLRRRAVKSCAAR